MPSSLTKQEASEQRVQQHSQGARGVETQEHHASANASAGVNLNLFGALSGAWSSQSNKTTRQNTDGSSDAVEETHGQGAASAIAHGQGNAYAAGNAQDHSSKSKSRGVGEEVTQAKSIEAKTDHLGIETS